MVAGVGFYFLFKLIRLRRSNNSIYSDNKVLVVNKLENFYYRH